MINILILSAGRRVELVKRFKTAAQKLNIDGKIIAADMSEYAPAIYFADLYRIIPRINSNEYIDALVDICNEEKITLIVPTIDTELPVLSKNRSYIESHTGAKILLSSDDVIDVCCYKDKTQEFFEKYGFGIPHLLNENDLKTKNYDFPLFIKPKNGSSSINAFKVENESQLTFFRGYIDEPIIQEYIQGTEYSIDVFCDLDSNPITIVPRIRLAVRGGEIIKGKIDKDREVIEEIRRMIDILKPVGQITVQCMKTCDGIKYIEINPRFGGGAPMSIDAGANSCENIYRILLGEQLKYNEDYNDGHLFLRFDEGIELTETKELVK